MGKIIGKFLFFIIFLSGIVHANLSMKLIDRDGHALERAYAGEPFILQVILQEGGGTFNRYPMVKGLEKFTVKNSGMRITTINGNTNATYSYELRIDMPGRYVIGPAEFQVGRNRFVSNTLSVEVSPQSAAVQNKPHRAKAREQVPVFMRLSSDKQRVVVGEKINCHLRFYFTDPRVALKQLIMQESKHINHQQMRGPVTGTEQINGVTYNYAEWVWDSYITIPGTRVIPAYGADYEREIEDNRQMWGGFARFFGARVEHKRSYSNAVSVQVDPLPTKQDIQGIGNFSYFHLSAQPSVAKQGEGIIITAELGGNGNMHQITLSSLKGIPKELRYYESKQSLIDPEESKDLYKKRFEFVVQGLKTGSWEIPSQSFTYYDVEKKAVKTIKSAPLTITIMPGVVKQNILFDDPTSSVKQVAPLDEHGPWYPVKSGWRFSWLMLIMLFVLPIVLLIIRGMMMHFKKRVKIPYELIREKYAFSNAQKRFDQLRQQQDARRLYALFVELMANKCKTSLGSITVPFIMMQLKKASLSDEHIEKWNHFFQVITERAYGTPVTEKDEDLFKQAEQWLNELQNIL